MKNILLIAASLCLTIHLVGPVNAAPAEAPTGFSGKVVETMNAANYTYVLVDTGTKKSWAAAPQFDVKVGDTVTVAPGMDMGKYHSKSMNRDFDSMYFTGGISVGGAPKAIAPGTALPAGHPPLKQPTGTTAQLPAGHPDIKGVTAKPALDLKNIKLAKGGKTVAQIYAAKKSLASQTISIRGKVVKYNAAIMGKNWLHVRDGSGSDAAGDNDLMVTSKTDSKVGDTVLVSGKVTLDKDFGAGYKYDVILDDAEVVVE